MRVYKPQLSVSISYAPTARLCPRSDSSPSSHQPSNPGGSLQCIGIQSTNAQSMPESHIPARKLRGAWKKGKKQEIRNACLFRASRRSAITYEWAGAISGKMSGGGGTIESHFSRLALHYMPLLSVSVRDVYCMPFEMARVTSSSVRRK